MAACRAHRAARPCLRPRAGGRPMVRNPLRAAIGSGAAARRGGRALRSARARPCHVARARAAILERPDANPRRRRRDRGVPREASAAVARRLTGVGQGMAMTFEVEIVLRERTYAVTERISHTGNDAP